jgi:hypothetical protein
MAAEPRPTPSRPRCDYCGEAAVSEVGTFANGVLVAMHLVCRAHRDTPQKDGIIVRSYIERKLP